MAEKIRARLAEPYVLTKQDTQANPTVLTHQCTASMGGVLVEPGATDMEAKMVLADSAMYQAKAQGRNHVVFATGR